MNTKILKNIRRTLALGLVVALHSSCEKFLTVEPPIDQVSTELVFNNDEAAKSAITGIYSKMMDGLGFASGSIRSVTALSGFSSDEFINYDPIYLPYYNNSLTAASGTNFWDDVYFYIYTANAVLEGINQSSGMTDSVKKQIEGEAKFIRAFCYFYLTNLFGDVPLHLTSDYRINNQASKTKQALIYQQIIKDLMDAQNQLSEAYTTTERVRPNKYAATALLARAYLYTKDWAKAEVEASVVLQNTALYNLKNDLNEVFLKNSTEAVWQLMPNVSGRNTAEATLFILTAVPAQISISTELLAAFEDGDKRKYLWIGSITVIGKTYYYPFKYKVGNISAVTEYSMVLRLAEQYLIRAEARIQQENMEGGLQDLNVLRTRARALPTLENPDPLPPLSINLSKENALLAVEKERRIELFSEWGHRWLDLKRTNRADVLLSTLKGNSWQSTDVHYPIPQSEIMANPKITQNEGY